MIKTPSMLFHKSGSGSKEQMPLRELVRGRKKRQTDWQRSTVYRENPAQTSENTCLGHTLHPTIATCICTCCTWSCRISEKFAINTVDS